jgi:hypothetical protein
VAPRSQARKALSDLRWGSVERQRESRIRDGQAWPIGRELEIAWIMDGTDEGGVKVTCAIPAIFDAYWTLELPYSGDHDWTPDEVDRFPPDLIAILAAHTPPQPWWLGFLERGPQTELVFDDAPRVPLYNGGYVLIEAGPEQAAAWRANNPRPTERQPELMFPHDRSWLATDLWDDDWFYFGGPSSLQRAFLGHPHLGRFARAARGWLDRRNPP